MEKEIQKIWNEIGESFDSLRKKRAKLKTKTKKGDDKKKWILQRF